jgi:hypothetical protein
MKYISCMNVYCSTMIVFPLSTPRNICTAVCIISFNHNYIPHKMDTKILPLILNLWMYSRVDLIHIARELV